MPINDKREYIFAERYKEQLIFVLRDSFAFNINSFDKSWTVKEKTGEAGTLTVRKVRVTTAESLLPRHCNPELVEQALAYLEANLEKHSLTNSVLLSLENENYKLLAILGKYTRNDRFDLMGYKIAVGTMFAMMSIMLICVMLMAIVLSFPIFPLGTIVYFGALFTAAVSCALGIVMANTEGVLGVKFGRWIGDLIKGKNREPSNLQDLDETLNQFINEQAKALQHEEKVEPVTYTKIYPPLFTSNNSDLTIQDAATNTNDDSFQQVPGNRFSMK
ncbi:hypothetical protein RVIR1_07030 [Candidatus Rickettsiella viridis]|uniref:Uncharacterized protein n=1 Tax=Candidatus Rickettsiella viridis TaxID=676208 RepID=A0A2Z5UUH5_9COXI|nr:hypothetical protein [Candidatus Rickettsiella viridis]BBB15199.1 hypothetical protein RVIR1_07030 [Candidatus Rickettsiella viridis]